MKMNLGKTRDSRSRKQAVQAVDVAAVENLQQELSHSKVFIQYLLKKGYSTTTTRRYVKDVLVFMKWLEKENLTAELVNYADVLHYVQSYNKKVKQRTLSTVVNSIKHYYNYLKFTGKVTQNPTLQIQIRGIKRRSLYTILTKKELERLYHHYEIPEENEKLKNLNWYKSAQLSSKRNKIILGLLIYQGLNTTDISHLTVKDLKLREGNIYVAPTRRSNERTLKLVAHQILDMMEYIHTIRPQLIALRKKDSEVLFINNQGGNNFYNLMNYLLHQLKQQSSKIESIRQIRSSVITHWLKNYNLREVQYMAGHRYVSSTEAYLINDLDDLQEDITKFHPLTNG